ncbi:Protein phosphatase 2C 7, variant 2 [Salvia divinorum]|uniref:protein-serine/threonine phosphatase n=1 Tax=Salvia divinorum TaxID=28513 RepID=A0ABD1I6U7_SALDI
MDEIALPLNLSNLIGEESLYATCVDTAGIDLIANVSKNLFLEPSMTKLPSMSLISENRHSRCNVPHNGVLIRVDSNFNNSKDDGDPAVLDSKCVTDSHNGICIEDCLNKKRNMSQGIKRSESWVATIASEIVDDLVSLEDNGEAVRIREPKRTFSASLIEITEEMKINKPNVVFSLPPLWGITSICGRRAEMEDAVVALPRFLKIPPQMLNDTPLFSSIYRDLTAHVYGVYDGHGGCQVANYCREHMHLALADEIGAAKENLKVENGEHNLKEKWLKIFQKCFHRLDNEVGGFPRTDGAGDIASDLHEPITPESVGSTASVAIVCSTHIIVANCGDSRAVLNRGKVPMPLSVDHKPNREDECARIEAAGGKVINWDGYRVSGVLAVSRSIGDRYLRPYVVADPEVMFVPRTKEDECLIVASDGLWDVMTNEEACDLARKRILIWHKRNGTMLTNERGAGSDPAAQEAAEYLSKLAFKRGSADNISVIVVDLKAQRKFKRKT